MKSLKMLGATAISNELIGKLTSIYTFRGKEYYYKEVMKTDLESILEQTIEKDVYFASKMLNIDVTDHKIKMLLRSKQEPKTSDEERILNLKSMFKLIQSNPKSFELVSNEISALYKTIFSSSFSPINATYSKTSNDDVRSGLAQTSGISKRITLDELNDSYNKSIKVMEYETLITISSYYIDFINIKPFTKNNDFLGVVILYIMICKLGFSIFNYVSFFELVHWNSDDLKEATLKSSYTWNDGFPQILTFYRFINYLFEEAYKKTDDFIRGYSFDVTINKTDNIENTILKMDHIFDKEDIRIEHPFVSESTINRTLQRLRDDNIIRPLGKGRSAKWIRLNKVEKSSRYEFLKE